MRDARASETEGAAYPVFDGTCVRLTQMPPGRGMGPTVRIVCLRRKRLIQSHNFENSFR